MVGKPLSARQRARIAGAVDRAEKACGLQFLVYIGEIADDDPRDVARGVLAENGLLTEPAVLVLVAPPQRRFEIVTGAAAHVRVADDVCQLAALHMRSSFAVGDITGGVCEGLRLLAQYAGPGVEDPAAELPDVLGA